MDVAAHQEKKKNEKTGKRKEGVERKQADFKEVACYPSAVVQRAARQKNASCEGSARGNWDTWKANSYFGSLYMYILYIRQKFRTSLSQKDRSQYVFGTDRKSEI